MKVGDVVRLLGQDRKMVLEGFCPETGKALLKWYDKNDKLQSWECPKSWLIVHEEPEKPRKR